MNKSKGGIYKMTEAVVNNLYEKNLNYEVKEKKDNVLLDRFISALTFYRLKINAKKLDYSNFIEIDKSVCDGKPVIKGTRITPEIIFNIWILKIKDTFDSDSCLQEVKNEYPALNDDKIFMALFYYISRTSYRNFRK